MRMFIPLNIKFTSSKNPNMPILLVLFKTKRGFSLMSMEHPPGFFNGTPSPQPANVLLLLDGAKELCANISWLPNEK